MRGTPHYDFEDNYADSPRLIHNRGLWFLVVALSSLGILSIIAVLLDAFQEPPITLGVRARPVPSEPFAPFALKGFALGSTLGTVRQAHPGLQASAGRQGLATATLVSGQGNIRLFFTDGSDTAKAYRIQTTEVLPAAGMAEAIAPLVRDHGPPASRNCRETMLLKGEECQFAWWLRGTTRLEVGLRLLVANSGAAETQMTVTATNTQLEGLALRGGGVPR